eukprot:gene53087-7507_t
MRPYLPHYSFMWVQGGNQEQLERSLRVDSGYPALVVINKDRRRY